MADLYDILNSGILDNWKPEQNRTKFDINTSSIKSSVPKNDFLKLKNMINGGKLSPILGKVNPVLAGISLIPDLYGFGVNMANISKPLESVSDLRMPGFASNIAELINKPSNKNISSDVVSGSNRNSNVSKPSDNSSVGSKKVSNGDLQDLPNILNQTSNESTPEGATTRVPNKDDISIMLDYISQLQDTREPYIKALESYVNNYGKNLDQARRADLYFYGANLAKGLDQRAGQKFNPLQNQADIINMLKLISDAKAGDLDAINELRGNMALANEMELPPEAAFANKNLLTALSQAKKYATDLEKARIVDAMRRYGYDRAYSRAIDQQKLRNKGNANTAMIYMGGGEPGVGLTQQGTVQSVVPSQQGNGGLAGDFAKTKG